MHIRNTEAGLSLTKNALASTRKASNRSAHLHRRYLPRLQRLSTTQQQHRYRTLASSVEFVPRVGDSGTAHMQVSVRRHTGSSLDIIAPTFSYYDRRHEKLL